MPESPWPTRRATHRKTGKAVSPTRRGRVRFLHRLSMSALWPTLPALVLTAAGRSSCYDMSTVRAEEYSPRQSRRAHFKSSSVPLSVGLRRLISTLEPRRPPQVCQHVRTCGQSAGGEIACLCLQWCAGVEADVTVQAIELDDVAVRLLDVCPNSGASRSGDGGRSSPPCLAVRIGLRDMRLNKGALES